MTPEEYEQLRSQLPPVPGATPALPGALATPADPSTLVSTAPPLTSQAPLPVPGAIASTAGVETPGQANTSALGQLLGGNAKAGLATAQTAQEMKSLPQEPKPIAPIGAKPAALGPGGVLGGGGVGLDPGVIAPRGGGGNTKGYKDAIASDVAKIDSSNKTLIGSYSEAQDEARKAGQAGEDTAIGNTGTLQSAVTAGQEIQSKQDQARDKAVARQQALSEQRAADLDKIKDVDPERYWSSKSTADHVRMSIGVALGALGAGLAKTPNFAQNLLDQAIQRDTESQRANIEKKLKTDSAKAEMAKDGLTREQWVAGQLQQKTLLGYEVAQKQMAASAATATSADSKAKLQEQIAGVEAKKQSIVQGSLQQDLARNQAALLAANAPSADAMALQKARAKQLDAVIDKRAANGEAPLTDAEMRNTLAGRGAMTGGGLVPGTVGGFTPGANKDQKASAADKKGEEVATANATVDAFGKDLKSDTFFSNPYGAVSKHFPGSDAEKRQHLASALNVGLIGEMHKVGLKGEAAVEAAKKSGAWVDPGGQNPTQLANALEIRKRLNAASIGAAPAGGGAGLPAGAKADD